jgi:hypothetical protein
MEVIDQSPPRMPNCRYAPELIKSFDYATILITFSLVFGVSDP